MRSPAACCRYIVIPCLTWLFCTGIARAQMTLEDAKEQQEKVRELVNLQTYMADEYAAALEVQRKVLAVHEQQLGPEHPDIGKSLNVLARLYLGVGNRTASEPLYLRALAIYEKANGPDNEQAAVILNNLASLYMDAGEYSKAEPFYLRAMTIAQKRLGPQHPSMVGYLSNIQLLYTEMAQYRRAEPFGVQALAVARKVFGQDRTVANVACNLAILYMQMGEYAKAEPLFLDALQIDELRFGKTHIVTASVLDYLGVLYDNTGAYRKAERLLQRALTIHEKASGPDNPATARTLERLGVLHYHMGNLAKAEGLLQRAVRIMETQLGTDHPETAHVLSNLGAVYTDRGIYPKAEELHQRALQIRQKTLGREHPEVAQSLLSLAGVQAATGAYAEAVELQQRALVIREQALGPNHPDVALALSELAELYRDTGELVKAAALLQRALAIREAAQDPEHPFTASVLEALGSLHRATGDYAKSEPLLRRALHIRDVAFGPDALLTSYSLSHLAQLYFATGRELQAKQLQERSCSGLRKSLTRNHPDAASCLNTLAQMHWGTNGATQALRHFKEARAAQARYSLRLLRTGSEARKRAYLRTVGPNLASQVSFSAAVRDPQAIELGLLGVLQYKGLLQDAVSDGIARVRNNASASDRKLLDQLASIASQFSSLVYQTNTSLSVVLQRQRIDELNSEQQRLETELAKRSGELQQQLSPVTLSQVRSGIPRDAVLIEWLRYQPYDPKDRRLRNQADTAPRYVAYVVAHQGDVTVVDVGDADTIDALVSELQLALGNPQRLDIKTKSAALAQRLYQPLQAHLRPYRQLLVSADGALNLVPLAVLLDERGRYLLEHFEITYLTSGRDLLRFGFNSRRVGRPVVVAAPAYGPTLARANAPVSAVRSVELDRSGLSFRPLPGALREGQQIARLLGVAANDLLVADAAKEETFKRLHGPRVLHVATHGFFLRDQAVRVTGALPENPLLRSGLALAGANARRSGARDDGILTAFELAQLDLQGTELVVLSACESGGGEVQIGEGVSGLRRALVLAGARAQLTSLWKIADLPTQELMVDYYQRLLRGVGRSAALREAQLAFMKSRDHAHPYYWAAFMPIGDWRALQVQEPVGKPTTGTTQAAAQPRTH
jgi:CHAT domain-containing protein/lipopolysaccharide biosynthesis regulator YciM